MNADEKENSVLYLSAEQIVEALTLAEAVRRGLGTEP
jgi:hypothetical protein